jgi:hypothetical protein
VKFGDSGAAVTGYESFTPKTIEFGANSHPALSAIRTDLSEDQKPSESRNRTADSGKPLKGLGKAKRVGRPEMLRGKKPEVRITADA